MSVNLLFELWTLIIFLNYELVFFILVSCPIFNILELLNQWTRTFIIFNLYLSTTFEKNLHFVVLYLNYILSYFIYLTKPSVIFERDENLKGDWNLSLWNFTFLRCGKMELDNRQVISWTSRKLYFVSSDDIELELQKLLEEVCQFLITKFNVVWRCRQNFGWLNEGKSMEIVRSA